MIWITTCDLNTTFGECILCLNCGKCAKTVFKCYQNPWLKSSQQHISLVYKRQNVFLKEKKNVSPNFPLACLSWILIIWPKPYLSNLCSHQTPTQFFYFCFLQNTWLNIAKYTRHLWKPWGPRLNLRTLCGPQAPGLKEPQRLGFPVEDHPFFSPLPTPFIPPLL